MFGSLFQSLSKGFLSGFRMLRSVFQRMTMGVTTKVRSTTNVSRKTTKAVSKATKNISQIGQKPTKRSDFIETKHSFISKSFLTMAFLALMLLIALTVFVLYPLAMRFFFTAKFAKTNSKLVGYTGKVIVFYDKDKEKPCYQGYLKDGKLQGTVRYYDEEGELVFEGEYTDNYRNGPGEEYQDGKLIYSGNFDYGKYGGEGRQYEDGILVCSGTYDSGLLDGDDCILYYPNGSMLYRGSFSKGRQTGIGTQYYESGATQYFGTFHNGIWEGDGTLFDEDGEVIYTGSFANNLFEGDGTLYLDNDFRLSGSFISGVQGGDVLISRSGIAYYTGSATNSVAQGQGMVYDHLGNLLYTGTMRGGAIDGSCLLGLTMDDVKTALGDCRFTETEKADGILLEASELGMSVYFSYPAEEGGDAEAFDVTLVRNGSRDEALEDFLWSFADDIDTWREQLWPDTTFVAGDTRPKYSAANYENSSIPCIIYPDGYGDCTVWMVDGQCSMLQWTVARGKVAEVESIASVLPLSVADAPGVVAE